MPLLEELVAFSTSRFCIWHSQGAQLIGCFALVSVCTVNVTVHQVSSFCLSCWLYFILRSVPLHSGLPRLTNGLFLLLQDGSPFCLRASVCSVCAVPCACSLDCPQGSLPPVWMFPSEWTFSTMGSLLLFPEPHVPHSLLSVFFRALALFQQSICAVYICVCLSLLLLDSKVWEEVVS